MAHDDAYDRVAFLRNVTGFATVAQEVDFGHGVARFVASGALNLREPTFHIRHLALELRMPMTHPTPPSNAFREDAKRLLPGAGQRRA